jgi:histidinol-phosphate aminotransferase
MNYPSILCGVEAVKDTAYFEKTKAAIVATREKTAEKLRELGFTVLPSSANFLFAAHKSVPAEELFAALREKHIFVRYFKKPRIQNFLRITIGTPQEMERFLTETENYLKK